MCYRSREGAGTKRRYAQEDIRVFKFGRITEHGEFASSVRDYHYKVDLLQPLVKLELVAAGTTYDGQEYFHISEGYHSVWANTAIRHKSNIHLQDCVIGLFIIPEGSLYYHYDSNVYRPRMGKDQPREQFYVSSQIIYKGIWTI